MLSGGVGAAAKLINVTQPAVSRLIGNLQHHLGLTLFERAILLVCAGMELNAAFGPLCAAVHGDLAQPYPTFSLALAAPSFQWY